MGKDQDIVTDQSASLNATAEAFAELLVAQITEKFTKLNNKKKYGRKDNSTRRRGNKA